ncbi:hypothetical protein D3C72_2179340 [compost metagenome]
MLLVFIADNQLHQTTGIGIERGFTQLQGVHLTQPFKALDVWLALLALELLQHACFFFFRQRVIHLFTEIDTVERRQRNVDVAVFHQRTEVFHEQRAQQRSNVQTV